MPLYSLKVQTFFARWKHIRNSSFAIFVDNTVLLWVLNGIGILVAVK